MPGDVVNLRRWRKTQKRDAKRSAADANATLHGLPKTVTDLAKARREREEQALDGLRLDERDEG
jgi:hypothetical protein